MCIDIGRAPGGWDNPFSVRLSVSVDLMKCTMEVLTWGADRAETNIYLDNKFNERTGFPEKCEERKKERDSEKKKEFPEPKAIAQLNCFFFDINYEYSPLFCSFNITRTNMRSIPILKLTFPIHTIFRSAPLERRPNRQSLPYGELGQYSLCTFKLLNLQFLYYYLCTAYTYHFICP